MSDSCGQPEKTAKNEMASGGRRRLLLALAAAPFAAFANTDPTAGLKRWGNGQFRRFRQRRGKKHVAQLRHRAVRRVGQ